MAMMYNAVPLNSASALTELLDSLGSGVVAVIAAFLIILLVAALITIGSFLRGIARRRAENEYTEDESASPSPSPSSSSAPTHAADDGALVAAITAAVAAYLEAEAAETGREAPAFRVVSFRRSWNGNTRR